MAYEPTTESVFEFPLASGGMQDLDPPFCYSTIFKHDLGENGTNEYDTVVSIGFRELGSQDLQVPFSVEVGPTVNVTYFGATVVFPIVTRLGPDEYTYLTVCVDASLQISAYAGDCQVTLSAVQAIPVNAAFNAELALVYLGREQAPFNVSLCFFGYRNIVRILVVVALSIAYCVLN